MNCTVTETSLHEGVSDILAITTSDHTLRMQMPQTVLELIGGQNFFLEFGEDLLATEKSNCVMNGTVLAHTSSHVLVSNGGLLMALPREPLPVVDVGAKLSVRVRVVAAPKRKRDPARCDGRARAT